MLVKLLKDHKEAKAESIVEVDQVTSDELVAGGIAVIYTPELKTIEEVEAKQKLEKEVINMADTEIKKEEAGPQIIVKKFETKSFRDAILDLKSGKVSSIEMKAPTGQDETDAADGLNLVYQGVEKVKGALELGSVVYPKCEKLPAPGANEYGRFVPYRDEATVSTTSSPRIFAPGEGTAKTPSKQAFGKHDLKFGTDAVVVYLTEEIMADVAYLEQYVISSCRGKLAWQRDYNILRGTYAAAVQGFIGVFDGGAANFYVEPVAHANPWTGAIVNGVIGGVDPRLRSGAEWYMSNDMHQNLLGDLGSGTTVSTQPLFSQDGKSLGGYPINIMTQQAAFGTATDVLFGNFSQYAVCEKTGIIMSVSKDLAFLTDEIVLRFTQRALGAPVFRRYQGLDAVNVAAFSSTSGT